MKKEWKIIKLENFQNQFSNKTKTKTKTIKLNKKQK